MRTKTFSLTCLAISTIAKIAAESESKSEKNPRCHSSGSGSCQNRQNCGNGHNCAIVRIAKIVVVVRITKIVAVVMTAAIVRISKTMTILIIAKIVVAVIRLRTVLYADQVEREYGYVTLSRRLIGL